MTRLTGGLIDRTRPLHFTLSPLLELKNSA